MRGQAGICFFFFNMVRFIALKGQSKMNFSLNCVQVCGVGYLPRKSFT